MKLGSFCYLPPRHVGNTPSFLENLKNFPAKHPVHLYSHAWAGEPGVIPLAHDVPEGEEVPRSTRVNLIFWTGVRIAACMGYTHLLCLENDCRFAVPEWDDKIWQEFLRKNEFAHAGGDLRVFNPQSYSMKCAARTEQLIVENYGKKPWPILIAGGGNLAQKMESCVFPNGALAIYDLEWLTKTYPAIQSTDPQAMFKFCSESKTWDFQIGIDLWQQFKEGVFDRVVQVNCAYSGYGDVLHDEGQRRAWLEEGKIVAVHQIKSDWKGPEPKNVAPPPPMKEMFPVRAPATFELPVAAKKKGGRSKKKAPNKSGLLWVTHGKDLQWFSISAKSYKKFAMGWHRAMCIVPKEDFAAFKPICDENGIQCHGGEQWPDKPFNWHQCEKICADQRLADCDLIYHCDADTIFAQPCKPEDWIVDGRILMPYTPYSAFLKRPIADDEMKTFMGCTGKAVDFNLGQYNWKFAVESALGHEVERECMAWAPIAHWRETYQLTRELLDKRFPDRKFDGYIRSCRDTHPQTFCEFNTLGAVAHRYFENQYEWYNLEGRPYPFYGKMIQSWSHGGLDREHDYGPQADPAVKTPRALLDKLGLI